jgi:hypothetical protein
VSRKERRERERGNDQKKQQKVYSIPVIIISLKYLIPYAILLNI